jgi:hypothetical protein
LGAAAGGGTACVFKRPVNNLWNISNSGKRLNIFRAYFRYDANSLCNGVLAGCVAITAGSDIVD